MVQGNREDNNNKIVTLKIIFYSISIIILICFAVVLLVSIIEDSKKVNLQTGETKLAVYYVEDIEDLHIGEEFDLENYYIKNKNSGQCYYHIDEDNILWGCGSNSSGVLGDIEKNEVKELIEINKNVIHVDCSEDDFMIFLTEDGELYGLGENKFGLMRLEQGDEYKVVSGKAVVDSPRLLMENVVYARCGKESIVVLKEDGSVWWWGELNTGIILTGSEMSGLRFQKPTKVLEDAVFVTANRANMAAIKKDGSLWTWGHNSVGNCGTEIKNYIENPKKEVDDVKMVWFESMEFNYSQTENIQFIPDEKYKIEYDFTTFVEKKDNSIWACGMNVSGKDSEIRKIDAYGDVLCSPSFVQINMEEQTMQELEQAERKTEDKEQPSKEMVLYMRSAVTEGMSEEEIIRITENIKVANHVMEEAYLYDRLFERLEDPENLYWNYMDQKGEIQIGWALADNPYDASSDLTFQEFEEKYGTPVITYNRFDADNFINLMIEMRDSLKSELLKGDFDNLIYYVQLAKDTHDVDYMIEVYRILHDMDYFLFRYGIEDVGKYVKDISTISKYYGVLNIYEEN